MQSLHYNLKSNSRKWIHNSISLLRLVRVHGYQNIGNFQIQAHFVYLFFFLLNMQEKDRNDSLQ